MPQYTLQKTDEPMFKTLSCDKLNPPGGFDCTGINKYMCQYRSWQAGVRFQPFWAHSAVLVLLTFFSLGLHSSRMYFGLLPL